jgi:predicted nucleotidyltransferase component of viral defense system
MDYLITNSREEMLERREIINRTIERYMLSQGYAMNPKTKNPHSLDSWVYDYMGTSGNRDNIKIEINYSLRSHILEAEERSIITEHFSGEYKVRTLAPLEIYGSKFNALLNRAAARDLYDIKNMIRHSIFDHSEKEMLKKCIIFYAAISAKQINKIFDTKGIDSITKRKIKTDLLPVIKTKDDFELETAKEIVKAYISDLMILTKEEKEFLDRFESGEYMPELLFEDKKIIGRVKNHPMAIWKTR